MSKINEIISELNLNEKKYTKATLKNDIADGKVLGWTHAGDKVEYLPVELGTLYGTVVENGVLKLGTGIMKQGRIVTASDATGETFDFTLGTVETITLKLK